MKPIESTRKIMEKRAAVIVVDIQGDFTTWKNGSLAVEGTDRTYVKRVEEVTKLLNKAGFPIFATQDWHPAQHISFYTNHPGKSVFDTVEIKGKSQILWPPHCIQGTEGACILIDNNLFTGVIKKGQNPLLDSYSGFRDDGGEETELHNILKLYCIDILIIYGIATDYCVKATALDAINYGYKVVVIQELSRGVAPDTSRNALREMRNMGVRIYTTFNLEDIIKENV